ncbi:MAG TPA: cellulase family glycosylhydrolase [Candidatus Angelobacter sp.]|nr:cellulase family glycosylhydrolase [Candidatus Angelobacter sp.]
MLSTFIRAMGKHRAMALIVILAGTITSSTNCVAQGPQSARIGVTAGTGTLLIAGTNTAFVPRGFTSLGVLYPTVYDTALCTMGNNSPGSADGKNLIEAQNEMTTHTPAVLNAMINDWFFNTVRFHVSQGALEKEYRMVQADPQATTPYTDMVRSIVSQARARNLIVIAVMQTEIYSCTAYRSDNVPQKLPDQNTANAWKQLLTGSTIANDTGVILEILNEPNTQMECGDTAPYNWNDWAFGCKNVSQEGMVTVGNILSRLAPNNVLLFDADNDAGGFQTFPSTLLPMMPPNSAYTVHPFDYVYGAPDVSTSKTHWDARFGAFQAQGNTVFITAWNESLNCPNDPNQTVTDDFVQQYLPAHSIGLLGVGWDAPQANNGYLVDSYGTNPTFAPQEQTSPTNPSPCNHTGAKLMQQQFQRESLN